MNLRPLSTTISAGAAASSSSGAGAGAGAGAGPDELDGRIWRHLPQPLLDRVLAFLPPPAFFRLRSVSRRFYTLLFSDSFLRSHLLLSPRFFWFAFFLLPPPSSSSSSSSSTSSSTSSSSSSSSSSPPIALLLDPTTLSWYQIPLSSLIPPSFAPAAASGGLLCFLSDSSGPKTLLLVNPISKIAAYLPPAPTPRLFPAIALSVGPSSVTAVVAGDDLISPFAVKNLTSETFHADGATGFYAPWTGPPSPLPRLCNIDPSRMAFAANRFYCMSSSPFAVLAYDVAANAWSKLQPPMRRFLRSPSIVGLDDDDDVGDRDGGGGRGSSGGGRIVLVAAVEKSRLSVPRSVRVWALQPCGRAWAEADRMPADVHARFCAAEAGRGFECVASGGVIAFTIKAAAAAAAAAAAEVLLFDSNCKEWRWAPPCPFVTAYGCGGRVLRGFAYEPRLATPAIGLLDSSPSLSFQGFSG